jgi:hypothetical protein
VADGVHVAAEGPEVRANMPDPNIHRIDPMMVPRGLPIIVPNGLKRVAIPTNLLKFTGSPNEDLTTHVERFVKVLITSLVTDHDYILFGSLPPWLILPMPGINPMLKDLLTLGNNSKLHSYAIIG